MTDSSVQKLRDLVSDSIRRKRDDLGFSKKLNPDSYRCGFDAGALSAFFIIADYIDMIDNNGGSKDE